MLNKSKRVYVKSFGCSANLADGEVIAGCLSEIGMHVVNNPNTAEVLVYNTCAVKSPTENRVIAILRKAPKEKKLIVTGCLPLVNFNRLNNEIDFDGVTGPAPGTRIVDILRRVIAGEKVVSLRDIPHSNLNLPSIPINPIVSIIPINYGCLGDCSFCCVRFARGRLRSNSVADVVKRVRRDLLSGIKEFWLTSQDIACYGKDRGNSLIELVNQICDINGDFFVRLGMMNPNHALSMLDDLVEVFKDEKIFKFLHLPVQSGDNRVLRFMNRHYCVEDFKYIVRAFKEAFPQLTLSTDVICGFPGESKEAFQNSLNLIAEISPDIVNISRFFSRPDTPAEKLIPIPPKELNERSGKIAELSKKISFKRNRDWLDWEGSILLDEKGKGESLMGRNFAYKPIVIQTDESLLGKFVQVRIVNAFSTYLKADIM